MNDQCASIVFYQDAVFGKVEIAALIGLADPLGGDRENQSATFSVRIS